MINAKRCGQCKYFRRGKPADQTEWPPRMGHCVGAHPYAEIHSLERACPEYAELPVKKDSSR